MATTTPSAELTRVLHLGGGARIRRIATRAIVSVAALAAVGGIGLWLHRRGAPKPVEYQTSVLNRGTLTVTVTATGSVQALNVVDVGSEVSGRIRRLLVEDNAHVAKGQVIAEIDPEIYAAQLEQARAVRGQAAAQLQQAQSTLRETNLARDRATALYGRGVIAQQELEATIASAERAAAAVALAIANVRQADATLKVAATNLTKTTIRSPIDGVVLSHAIEAGQTVVAAFQTPVLFKIAEDLRAMRVEVDVDEADIGKVREGQAAKFTVSAFVDRTFEARVSAVHNAARVIDRVVSYEADLAVDNAQLVLRPGMTATAEIIVDQIPDALIAPGQSLRFTPRGEPAPTAPQVWVLRDGKPVAVPVRVLGQSETEVAVAAPGLTAGDRIVTNAR